MRGPCKLVYEIARTGSPIVLIICPRSFQRNRRDNATMLMCTDPPTPFNPQNVCDRIGSYVETKVLNRSDFSKRNPRGLLVITGNIAAIPRIFTNGRFISLLGKLNYFGLVIH